MSEMENNFGINSEPQIALPQIPHEFLREPQLSLENILAVQALSMGFLRMRARSRRQQPEQKRHGFVMFDKGGSDIEDVYDGSTDTYMGCLVQKVSYDQWRMVVSLLSTLNTEPTKAQNVRRLYKFDWLRNGNRQAWHSEILRRYEGNGQTVQMLAAHPINDDICLGLQEEMLAICQRANPLTSDSIYMPITKHQ